jgi:hypothetical protein
MKSIAKTAVRRVLNKTNVVETLLRLKYRAVSPSKRRTLSASIYREFRNYTRVPEQSYCDNLRLVERFKDVPGTIVECGVWRGGMIAGIARILGPDRAYYLFDSFEGLPKATQIDGERAVRWQVCNDVQNCRTDEIFAFEAMRQAGAINAHVYKGWFDHTLRCFPRDAAIAVLRLDADWYSSTAECLNNLYAQVVKGGLIIVDDYFAWDGCARAIHDFLSYNKLTDRIRQFDNGVCYLLKSEDRPVKAIPVNPGSCACEVDIASENSDSLQ